MSNKIFLKTNLVLTRHKHAISGKFIPSTVGNTTGNVSQKFYALS